MKRKDQQYLVTTSYGSWRMTVWPKRRGYQVSRRG